MQKYTILLNLDGWCNNPTALAFRATMRRMLAHCGQISSYNGNCTVEPEEVSPDRVESLSAAVTRDMGADDEERESTATVNLQRVPSVLSKSLQSATWQGK